MNNNCCRPEDIFRLNNSKEYVLLSQHILELVVTDNHLCAQTTKLWQFLYSKAKFDENLSLTISYASLAKVLGKSVRTIARYIANLEEFNYLQIIPNYDARGSRIANTLLIRIPVTALAALDTKKDRKESSKNLPPHDKIDRTAPDNLVIAKDKIKKEIINNNNVVVPREQNSKKTDIVIIQTEQTSKPLLETKNAHRQKTEELNYLKEILLQKEQDFLAEKDTMKKFELNRQCGEIEAAIEVLNHQINYQQQALAHKQKTQQAQESMLSNIHEMAHLPGPRPISDSCFSRLKQTLLSLGYHDNRLNQTLNEIIQEARFGSLVKQQGNVDENPVEKAVNIALKLVREGRWQSPRRFKPIVEQRAQPKLETFFIAKHTLLPICEYLGQR